MDITLNKNKQELMKICRELKIKGFSNKNKQELIHLIDNYQEIINDDRYTSDILRKRYSNFKNNYEQDTEIIETTKLNIRRQNPPEDITENIVKFIIQNYGNDLSCKWAKGIGKKGDLCSDSFDTSIEVKAFISNGPSQFGPKKKFGVIYFLDLRTFMTDNIILWKVNLNNESPEIKNIKMNKTQTYSDQCLAGRRPHISWNKLYPQIHEHCHKIYEGTFENIFQSSFKN